MQIQISLEKKLKIIQSSPGNYQTFDDGSRVVLKFIKNLLSF